MKRIVAVIVGVGFLHRLLFLGARQLWTDELMQARIVKFGSPIEIIRHLRDGMDLASPLDFFVQRGMTLVFGDAAWAMRLHAVLFGTLSIWIFYRLSRFLFTERVAVYSTVLFAFFPLAYHYSQEARPYALLMFLTLLSYDLLLRQVYDKDRGWQGWLAVTFVLTLLLYTSFLGGLIILSQMVALVISAVSKAPAPVSGQGAGTETGGAALPPARRTQVVMYGLSACAAALLFYPWVRFAWARPLLAPASEIADPKLILRIIKELGDNSYPAAGLLLIGIITGVRALRRHGRNNSLIWLLTWFLIPIPVLLIVELWAGYFFAIRHILHATPPLVLIAGYGLSYVGERLSILSHLPYQVSSPAILYAGLLVLMTVWIGQSHAHSEPADWKGTAAFLTRTVRPGDVVSAPMIDALLEYYDPGLSSYRRGDLDPDLGSLAYDDVQRRIVVCYDKLWPDPCADFRAAALKDKAWGKMGFTGFSVFVRTK